MSIATNTEPWLQVIENTQNISTVWMTYSFDADEVAAAAAAGDWELGDDKDADESVQICDSFLQQK